MPEPGPSPLRSSLPGAAAHFGTHVLGRAAAAPTAPTVPTATDGAAEAAGVFTKYVFAFEITGALLITAAVGAMVLT
ncbi:hypothetical protein ACWCO6_34745, partial [Streptomyces sp. NPDC001809]